MKANSYRTHYCGEINESLLGHEVTVSGWVEAIRNHDIDSLVKGFEVVGYTKEEVESRFRSIYTAFSYGAPPHGGMAPGIDRILMLLLDETNLREVQAFPTSASGADGLMGSPSTLTPKQLKELGIKIEEVKK